MSRGVFISPIFGTGFFFDQILFFKKTGPKVTKKFFMLYSLSSGIVSSNTYVESYFFLFSGSDKVSYASFNFNHFLFIILSFCSSSLLLFFFCSFLSSPFSSPLLLLSFNSFSFSIFLYLFLLLLLFVLHSLRVNLYYPYFYQDDILMPFFYKLF